MSFEPSNIDFAFGAENSKRAQAEAALQESEARFRAYVEQAAEALFVHDFHGRYIEVNRQACASLGYSRGELLRMKVGDVELGFDLAAAQTAWSRLEPNEPFTVRCSQRRKDGSMFPVEVRLGCFLWNGVRFYLGTARDITERALAELEASRLATLREREIARLTRLYSALSQVNQAIVWTPTQAELFQQVCQVLVEHGGVGCAWIGWLDAESGQLAPVAQFGDRQREWLVTVAFPIHSGGDVLGRLTVYSQEEEFFQDKEVALLEEVANDVSFALGNFAREAKRERAEASLLVAREREQHLGRRLLQVQENERRKIARDLHDEVGQLLTALKINLQLADRQADPRAGVSIAVDLVDRALQKTRAISLGLSPPMLEDLGLEPALRWLIGQQVRVTGRRITFDAEGLTDRLPPLVETACFRIVQEALTNALRHTPEAVVVRLQLTATAAQVTLCVRDEGQGFDLPAARARALQGASLGLLNMEERAELAGGQVVIHTRLEGGTVVSAEFPLAAPSGGGEISIS